MTNLGDSALDARLVEAARAVGFERLTPLQESALPVLRRGGNVVLHASSGAGVTAAWLLPLLDRLLGGDAPEGDGPRALVLAPTQDLAGAIAGAGSRLAPHPDIAVRAAAPGWRSAGADVLVTTPERALRDVQGSALKLERVQALVITDLSEQLALGRGDALGTVSGLIPRDAQRVVTTAQLEGDAERFVEAQVRRALTVPARPADPADRVAGEPVGQIGYLVLTEADKPELLARLLDGVEGEATVYVRSARRVDEVRGEVSRRGTGAAISVHVFSEQGRDSERVISYDVPFSAADLRAVHETGGTVFVTPAELAHFRRIAAEVPFTLKQRRARSLEQDDVDAFREMVRSAVEGEDLAAQLLVLDPLLEDHSPAEVVAALSALL